MSALDGLKKMSFSGNLFPYERLTLRSQGRQYLFEFPKQAAGAFEKLGRGIWVVGVSSYFVQGLRGYPDSLYPDTMNALATLYENQTTATFHHPTRGDWPAFISSWKQDTDPRRMRNGERVEIEFVEDQTSTFLAQAVQSVPVAALKSAQADFDAQIAAISPAVMPPVTQINLGSLSNAAGLFAAIRATSNAIAAVSDTTAMYTGLLQAKATELSNLCAQVDALPQMQSSLAMGAIDALHNIWAAATQFTRPQGTPLSKWKVPQTMGVQQIAVDLYGDASRQSDILNLNGAVISDPSRVPAGTIIQYNKTPSTMTYGSSNNNGTAVQ